MSRAATRREGYNVFFLFPEPVTTNGFFLAATSPSSDATASALAAEVSSAEILKNDVETLHSNFGWGADA